MAGRLASFPKMPALALACALAACSGTPDDAAPRNADSLDAELAAASTANGSDPLIKGALQDQIMVDPKLAQIANADSVRPPSQPYSAPIPSPDVARMTPPAAEPLKRAPAAAKNCPQCAVADRSLTLAALAARQGDGRTRACAGRLSYAAGWANRLPADIPLYPTAHVIEAAGSAGSGCALRAVSLTVAQPLTTMLDWYYTRVSRAGYSAEHQADGDRHVLGGTRARDGGAYVLFLTARGDGGTDIDLIANNGI